MAARSRGHAASHSRGQAEFATHGLAGARVDRIAAICRCRARSLDAMADPVFTELVQRIRGNFFTQSTLD
jgi:hypothetical protein